MSKKGGPEFECLLFDYTLSLASLESYANRNLLVEGVQVEQILLHNEPLTQIINETNHVYSAQSCLIEDRVSKQILNEHKMCINPYHNRGMYQMRKKGAPEFECL
jgi:hypothetical protein